MSVKPGKQDLLKYWHGHRETAFNTLSYWHDLQGVPNVDAVNLLGQWESRHEDSQSQTDVLLSWVKPVQPVEGLNVLALWGSRRTVTVSEGQWIVAAVPLKRSGKQD